jgi:hypothetical protein
MLSNKGTSWPTSNSKCISVLNDRTGKGGFLTMPEKLNSDVFMKQRHFFQSGQTLDINFR